MAYILNISDHQTNYNIRQRWYNYYIWSIFLFIVYRWSKMVVIAIHLRMNCAFKLNHLNQIRVRTLTRFFKSIQRWACWFVLDFVQLWTITFLFLILSLFFLCLLVLSLHNLYICLIWNGCVTDMQKKKKSRWGRRPFYISVCLSSCDLDCPSLDVVVWLCYLYGYALWYVVFGLHRCTFSSNSKGVSEVFASKKPHFIGKKCVRGWGADIVWFVMKYYYLY